MSVVKQQEHKKKVNPYLPFIGLVLAVSIGLLAFGASALLKDVVLEQFPEIKTNLAEEENGELYMQGTIGVIIWFTGFVIAMSVVSMGMAKDIIDDEYSIQVPINPTQKDIEKYRKAMSKNRQDKIKVAKRLKKKKDQEASHRR